MNLPNFGSLKLRQHCLFCLIRCNKSDRVKTPGQEQVLQVLFAKNSFGPGEVFRNLFWQLLLGPRNIKGAVVKEKEIEEFLKGEVLKHDDSSKQPNLDKGDHDETGGRIPVCSYCLEMLVDIRGLYTELERIQMLLVTQVSNLQKIVRGSHLKTKGMLRDAELDRPTTLCKETLERLDEFQTNVISHSASTGRFPYVVIERISMPLQMENMIDVKSVQNAFQKFIPEDRETIREPEVPLERRKSKPPRYCKPEGFNYRRTLDDSTRDSSKLKRRRGRPPKFEQLTSILGSGSDFVEAVEPPPVQENQDSDTDWSPPGGASVTHSESEPDDDGSDSADDEFVLPTPAKRGRPPKTPSAPTSDSQPLIPKRGPGRPPGKKSCRLYIRKLDRKEPAIRKKVHHSIFRCEICSKIYFKRIAFLKHQLAHKEGTVLPPEDVSNSLEFDIEGVKECGVCKGSFPESEYNAHLLTHEQFDPLVDHSDKKLFPCTHKDCIRKFQVEENLKIHVELDHNEMNSRCFVTVKRCDLCNVCYSTSNDLLEHFRKIHKPSRKTLLFCPVCSHAFTKDENVIVHMHSHITNDQQICFKCPVNGKKKFPKRADLLLHFRDEHQLATSGNCGICQKPFDDLYWLKVHLRSEHKIKDTFVCSYCGKRCFHASAFMKHYNNLHTKIEKNGLPCEDCDEKFPNEDKLLRHRVVMHGAPKLKCSFCELEYSTTKALNTHMKVHREEGFKCEVCQKHFSFKNNLRQHMAVHSDSRPYTCELCGAGCKTYWQLRSHRQKHNKSHSCSICGRQFSRVWSLKNHMKMHTGEVVQCQFCGYEFHSEKSLKRHVLAYHVGDEDKLKPLYAPQKRRNPRSNWKDEEGNTIYARTTQNTVQTEGVAPEALGKSKSQQGTLQEGETKMEPGITFDLGNIHMPSSSAGFTEGYQVL